MEISGAFGPVYDAERFGARLVASPRHADALLVTGVVTHNMVGPLRNTIDATPQPRRGDRLWGLCPEPRGVRGCLWRGRRGRARWCPSMWRFRGARRHRAQIVAALRSVTGQVTAELATAAVRPSQTWWPPQGLRAPLPRVC